jgi:signal transduction histidine kinase
LAQASKADGVRPPRGPRVALAAALACWAVLALAFALSSQDTGGRSVAAVGLSWSAALYAGLALVLAVRHLGKTERLFWVLVGGGLLFRFAGDVSWTVSRVFGIGPEGWVLAPQDLAYAASYGFLIGGMLWLIRTTNRGIAGVTALDALGVMLSVGTLSWYFVLSRAELGGVREVLVALSQPVCDAALLYLGLVILSTRNRPPFAGPLVAAYVSFLAADGIYLVMRSRSPYELGGWPDLFWSLGLVLIGVAALRTAPANPAGYRVAPWRVFSFWLGPLSPSLHYGFLLLWCAYHPPVPYYVLVGAAALFLYLALRIGVVASVHERLGEEQQEMTRRMEENRVLYELHDTVKQSVHGVTLTLRAALDAERRGEPEAARKMLGRALEASREAEYRVSKPYDDLQEEEAPTPGEHLRNRLLKFEEYFGIKTHEDFWVPFEVLSPGEVAASQRVFVEASWNVAKHSGARNLWLETRRVGDVVIVRTRDDGRGFDLSDPPPGLGLRYMRRRAAEVGADLDVISAPGRGTTVQLRFDKG